MRGPNYWTLLLERHIFISLFEMDPAHYFGLNLHLHLTKCFELNPRSIWRHIRYQILNVYLVEMSERCPIHSTVEMGHRRDRIKYFYDYIDDGFRNTYTKNYNYICNYCVGLLLYFDGRHWNILHSVSQRTLALYLHFVESYKSQSPAANLCLY